MDASSPMYRLSPSIESSLRQGEILSGVRQFVLDVPTIDSENPTIRCVVHPFAVLMSQDCDLNQDYAKRSMNIKCDKIIDNVNLCTGFLASEVLTNSAKGSKSEWQREKIGINKNERFHFFQSIAKECDSAGEGIPELTLDFKQVFSIRTDELYDRIRKGITLRRAVLCAPYAQHLSHRHSSFQARVGLPLDYTSE